MIWLLFFPAFAALMAAFVVWAVRTDARNSLDAEIQASMARKYELSRDVWFGREPVAVVRDGSQWVQYVPPPAPAIQAAPVVVEPVIEEGAA